MPAISILHPNTAGLLDAQPCHSPDNPAGKSLKRKPEGIIETSPKRQRTLDTYPGWQPSNPANATSSGMTVPDGRAALLNALCASAPVFAGTKAANDAINALAGHAPSAYAGLIRKNRSTPPGSNARNVTETIRMNEIAALFPKEIGDYRFANATKYIDLISDLVEEISNGNAASGADEIKSVLKLGLETMVRMRKHYAYKKKSRLLNQAGDYLVKKVSMHPRFSKALKDHYVSKSKPALRELGVANALKAFWCLK